ncbi:MAG TPA: HAD family hydrolase [Steroidobacteraceae bacterium]|nr:HAD family hydrolase [Steroidobacteraceae bacterium]
MAFHGVFVDRDGTINVERGHVHRIEDFEFIPGALAALRRLTDAGIRIFIVSNQAGIAKGLYTESDFAALTRYMLGKMTDRGIRISDVLYCPHHPEAVDPAYRLECDCRKPKPGLLRQVMRRDRLSPGTLALIGDKNSDIEAGRAVGVRTYLVETGYGRAESDLTSADHVVADLSGAVDHLLAHSGEAGPSPGSR